MIDKVRTSSGIVEELKKIDPDTPIRKHAIDVWAKNGLIFYTTVGNRRYISLNSVLEFLSGNKGQQQSKPKTTEAEK